MKYKLVLISLLVLLIIICAIITSFRKEFFTNSSPPELDKLLGIPEKVESKWGELSQRVSGIPTPSSISQADPVFITGTGETSNRLVGAKRVVYGNNGTVSCSKYCGGTNYSPWNKELPKDWFGAKCVSTSDPKYSCDMRARKPINCTCAPTGGGWNA